MRHPLIIFQDAEEILGTFNKLAPLKEKLPNLLEKNFNDEHHGDLSRWLGCLDQLPTLTPSIIKLDDDVIRIGSQQDCSPTTASTLKQVLQGLHPWRKGPFNFFGVPIETEWRSDWKWNRLKNHIDSLEGKTVLDVGCGSGYHCWRMRGAGAHTVMGIEPGPLFVVQFYAAQHYIQDKKVQVLPLRMEDMPANLQAFNSVFSMGLLYHRRSPMDHLLELREALQPGGQLVLETLVINGKAGEILVPEARYGKMGNVWFIPSPLTLEIWLKKTGFVNVQCIDITATTAEEQRSTEWMRFQSLKDFLDPSDSSRTIEGHPAPVRCIFTAHKPL